MVHKKLKRFKVATDLGYIIIERETYWFLFVIPVYIRDRIIKSQ